MKKATVVIALVVIVLAVFLLKPDLLGSGGDAPSLAILTPEDDVMSIPTDISCSDAQDCIDYALEQDPSATDVRAVCDGTCTFITEQLPVEVQP